MYTSEDINTTALYNLHYTGAANRKKDSQEQYEAALASWGFANHSNVFSNKITKAAKKSLNIIKASFSLKSAAALMAKQHNASSHIAHAR